MRERSLGHSHCAPVILLVSGPIFAAERFSKSELLKSVLKSRSRASINKLQEQESRICIDRRARQEFPMSTTRFPPHLFPRRQSPPPATSASPSTAPPTPACYRFTVLPTPPNARGLASDPPRTPFTSFHSYSSSALSSSGSSPIQLISSREAALLFLGLRKLRMREPLMLWEPKTTNLHTRSCRFLISS